MRDEGPPGEEDADGPCIGVRVPAKINLFLAVRGRAPDGYHDLVTILQTISVYDRLRVGVYGPPGRGHHPAARRRMRIELRQEPRSGLPTGEDNLAVKAARTLGGLRGVIDPNGEQRSPSKAEPRTVLDLEKTIPLTAGLAGGSADAAGALVALNELWGCELSTAELREVAMELGSDVPFCVSGGTALATGRGTTLAPVLCGGTFHWVVCESDDPLPTGEVYRVWDDVCEPTDAEPQAVLVALREGDPWALAHALHNELEPAALALRPDLGEGKKVLADAGALGAMVAGSGPTLVALARDAPDAERLREEVGGWFPRVHVGTSPAGGPRLRPC